MEVTRVLLFHKDQQNKQYGQQNFTQVKTIDNQ